VTVISDDAGEFAKTVEGSQLARGRLLDWFHIAMKFNAAQRSVFGSKVIDSLERESIETEITHAKWLVWHGKGRKALERIRALDTRLLMRTGYELSTLWWNLDKVSWYLRKNVNTLVNYGARHRKGLPISSSIAESAVNQVVSHRMAKKRQMRWTDEGAHCMVQVRVAVLNGELSPDRISALKIAASRRDKCNGPASPEWPPTNEQNQHLCRKSERLRKAASPPFARSLAKMPASNDAQYGHVDHSELPLVPERDSVLYVGQHSMQKPALGGSRFSANQQPVSRLKPLSSTNNAFSPLPRSSTPRMPQREPDTPPESMR